LAVELGDVGRRIDKCRVLFAEFQEDRREVFGSGTSDDLAHLDGAREEDKVERELQELSAISSSIPDHSR
jgi:hypothetical protein